jgi:hypothetical protein
MEREKDMKRLHLYFLSLLSLTVLSSPTWAGIHVAASPSYADVTAAVAAAQSGDTVVVPAGSATWNQPLSITRGITLQGAGIDQTVITSTVSDQFAGLIRYAPASPSLNEAFRVTGFTLDANKSSNGIYLQNSTAHVLNQVRIDNNRIINPGGANAGRGIVFYGTIFGVVDHNTIEAGGAKAVDAYGINEIQWSTLGRDFGTADCIYYEDNNFINSNTFHSAGHGGRYVSRYNTYTCTTANLFPIFDIHGNQAAGFATMVSEIYGNTINLGTRNAGLFDQRGAQALIFNNTVNTTGSVSAKTREEYDDATYPYSNSYLQHVTNSYYWENRKNGSTLINCVEGQDLPGNVIQENRDFYNQTTSFDGTVGVGIGLWADRPATCTPGVAYWATDVGSQGTLYKCTAVDTWSRYYEPYTYPHPLTVPEPSTSLILGMGGLAAWFRTRRDKDGE